jgi:hypothetical protein
VAATPGRVTDVRFADSPGRLDPSYSNSRRFVEIHDRSGAFEPGAVDVLNRSRLSLIWLEHLLLLSMLQHDSGGWTWGRYVVVHPDGNTDIADANDEYRKLLADDTTFTSATIEDLLPAKLLAPKTGAALRRRYLP